ncbi:hypothetical protein CEXT_268141 [Caerostris extrusa]|uniref:Uncharacterized protein n=1 Tax=Caerostris extrusa TaxID=172846 RepID=A0AAV4TQV2_CAEEX|nr:hypothetical protein CEXT_268141 [Caerostris extrusa]
MQKKQLIPRTHGRTKLIPRDVTHFKQKLKILQYLEHQQYKTRFLFGYKAHVFSLPVLVASFKWKRLMNLDSSHFCSAKGLPNSKSFPNKRNANKWLSTLTKIKELGIKRNGRILTPCIYLSFGCGNLKICSAERELFIQQNKKHCYNLNF